MSRKIQAYVGALRNGHTLKYNRVPTQKALDLFRPGWDIEQNPIPPEDQQAYTTRINITFRFYRDGTSEKGSVSGSHKQTSIRYRSHCRVHVKGHLYANAAYRRKCDRDDRDKRTTSDHDFRLLRADQKAKARSKLPPSPSKRPKEGVVDDDMIFFWQCQSPGQTGDLKGCGFFRVLDMVKEGRGPCIGD